MEQLFASGVWRPAWFVALLSAGGVLMIIGIVNAALGERDGFYLMLVGVVFWGLSAVMLAYFSFSRPKPPTGRGR